MNFTKIFEKCTWLEVDTILVVDMIQKRVDLVYKPGVIYIEMKMMKEGVVSSGMRPHSGIGSNSLRCIGS